MESLPEFWLAALDTDNNGSQVWVTTSSDPFTAPALTGGGMIVMSRPYLGARDAQTGGELWNYRYIGGIPPSAAAIADAHDVVYVGWGNGTLSAYIGATGALLGRLATGLDGDVYSTALSSDGRIYAAGNSHLYAIGAA